MPDPRERDAAEGEHRQQRDVLANTSSAPRPALEQDADATIAVATASIPSDRHVGCGCSMLAQRSVPYRPNAANATTRSAGRSRIVATVLAPGRGARRPSGGSTAT